MSHIALDSVLSQAQQLSVQDRLQLMQQLAASLQLELAPKSDWHSFLQQTYGSLADDPIERWDQGEYEEREPIE